MTGDTTRPPSPFNPSRVKEASSLLVDYEKGVPAWDISMMLTLHKSRAHGDPVNCARVANLLATRGQDGHSRMEKALATPCDCGKGDSIAERTTHRKEEHKSGLSTTAA
jgi:hypothetical protein